MSSGPTIAWSTTRWIRIGIVIESAVNASANASPSATRRRCSHQSGKSRRKRRPEGKIRWIDVVHGRCFPCRGREGRRRRARLGDAGQEPDDTSGLHPEWLVRAAQTLTPR